jgi:tetratricopeptide (TPR) repeat protein
VVDTQESRVAAAPDAALRDASQAIQISEQIVAVTARQQPKPLSTLAAAYAEIGSFAKAVEIQKNALTLSPEGGEKQEFSSRLKLYESGVPFHGAPQPSNE